MKANVTSNVTWNYERNGKNVIAFSQPMQNYVFSIPRFAFPLKYFISTFQYIKLLFFFIKLESIELHSKFKSWSIITSFVLQLSYIHTCTTRIIHRYIVCYHMQHKSHSIWYIWYLWVYIKLKSWSGPYKNLRWILTAFHMIKTDISS